MFKMPTKLKPNQKSRLLKTSVALWAATLLLAGCGQKGPLTLTLPRAGAAASTPFLSIPASAPAAPAP